MILNQQKTLTLLIKATKSYSLNISVSVLLPIYNISKCFYPGNLKVPASKDLIKYLKVLDILPSRNVASQTTAVVHYDPTIIRKYFNFRHHHNPLLGDMLTKNCNNWSLVTRITQKDEKTLKKEKENIIKNLNPMIDEVLKYVLEIDKNKTIYDLLLEVLINNTLMQERDLKMAINILDVEKIEPIHKDIAILLRDYFKINHPTIELAEKFLKVWYKVNPDFQGIYDVPYERTITKKICEEKSLNNTFEKSRADKEKELQLKISEIIEKTHSIFSENKHDYKEIINTDLFKDWLDFLESRGSVLYLQPEELVIYEKFKELFKNLAPKEEVLLANRKDVKQLLRNESNLPLFLLEDVSKQCFSPNDFRIEIKRIQDSLELLEKNNQLSITDLKLLALNSSVAIIDEENTFKLTQEAYKSLKNYAEILNFKYTNQKPQIEYILSKIENNDFFIANTVENVPGTIMNVSHLSHKTLIVYDDILNKHIYIRIGFLTSAKDGTSIMLDKYQKTNTDYYKQKKEQRFRICSNFIIVDDNEPLTIDLETTLFFHGKNSEGKFINKILMEAYNLKKDIWSNNFYQKSYNIDAEFLHKITIIFFHKKLEFYEKKKEELIAKLKECAKNEEEYIETLENLEKMKNDFLEEKRKRQYYSLLPEEFKQLYNIIKIFELKKKKDEDKKEKEAQKKAIEEEMEKRKSGSHTENQEIKQQNNIHETNH